MFLFNFRKINFSIRQGREVSKTFFVDHNGQSPWLAKCRNFNAHQRPNAKNSFEKIFSNILDTASQEKTISIITKRTNHGLIDETDTKKGETTQSKISFLAITEDNGNTNFYAFNRKIIVLTNPSYEEFCVLELSNLLTHEWFYDRRQP